MLPETKQVFDEQQFIRDVEHLGELVDRISKLTHPIFAAVFKGQTEIKGNPEIKALFDKYLELKEKVSSDACIREVVENDKLSIMYQRLSEKLRLEMPPINQLYYFLAEKGYL